MITPFPWPSAVPNAFAFVLNPFHYNGELPMQLFPRAQLDHANPSQLKIIEEIRDKLGHAGRSMAFQHEPILEETRASAEWNRILPPRTTFWVINFDVHPTTILKFRQASQLTDNEFEIGGILPPEEQPFLPRVEFTWSMQSYFDRAWRNDAQRFNVDDIVKAVELARKIEIFRQKEVDDPATSLVLRVFDDFIDLSHEHRIGHLRLLGHFALIEALITHDPAESRRLLSHQVRTKMPLLMRRFHRQLDLEDFFAVTDLEEAWRLLYRLRSCFAHGAPADFDKPSPQKGFRELDSLYQTFQFVRESLKRLLIFALNEPQFVFDLKAC